ncbi:MAG: ATPase, T2SS/T4P/T4SS family [Candidatus Dependentiae bacterium]
MDKKNIGDVLISLKAVPAETVQKLLSEENVAPERIGDVLVARKALEPAVLSKALAHQLSLPFIEVITEQMADTTLLSKVPLKFLRKNKVVPLMYEGAKYVVTADPRDLQPLDDLRLLLPGITQQAVAAEETITETINRYYPLETSKEMMDELKEEDDSDIDLSGIEDKDIMEMANDAPIVKLVNHILFQAVKDDASDIHIEAFEKELRVRYRMDGAMHIKLTPPKRYLGAIVSRVKIMANLNIAEKRIPQDGRIQIKVAGKAYDVRVSVLPCNFGERVVMRMLDKTKGAVPLDKLNLSENNYGIVRKVIERPNGIILVSGPTGSGKTSTLYAILNHLNKPDVNIITVENPVEYTVTGINQVQVNEKVGLTFAAALRSILRQDPDVVLIGEIRDKETARIATEAALTGHLVLSTIHTNSAPATVTRLIDMGVEPFLVSSALACVISQRLVRRVNEKTRKAITPDAEMLSRLGITQADTKGATFYEAAPGETPGDTGYSGRLAIHEVMLVDEDISRLIIEQKSANDIKEMAIQKGMVPLTLDGVRCIKAGITTPEEVLSVSYIEEADGEDNFKVNPLEEEKEAGQEEKTEENKEA